MKTDNTSPINYSDENIRTLEWNQHIRQRPGMYIGQLGNGSDPRDGIYTLLKEIIDNSIDEFTMGFGTNIIVDVDENSASVRDFGRGIPLGSVVKAKRGSSQENRRHSSSSTFSSSSCDSPSKFSGSSGRASIIF